MQNVTSPLSPLTSMLLSNITSHPSLLPQIANLTIPIVPLTKSTHYPPYHLPYSASSSSTIHPDFRDPAVIAPNVEAGQEPERQVEALRGLVQAFEDGAGEGVKDGKGKRKGECHFLASVFANVSMVSVAHGQILINSCQLRDNSCSLLAPLSHYPVMQQLARTMSRCFQRLLCLPDTQIQ